LKISPRFDVLVPETIEQACTMLAEHTEDGVRLLAGGTDLLVDLRRPIIPLHVPRCDGCPRHPEGNVLSTVECTPDGSDPLMPSEGSIRATLTESKMTHPAYLVSMHKLKALKTIKILEDGQLSVGALTTISEIERSEEIRKGWTALSNGAESLGSPLVRNRGTLGGNIANARPAADTAIPTVALGAKIILKNASGTREVAAEDFARGPGVSVMKPDEILIEVIYPAVLPNSGSAYYKLANRKALEISTVGVAIRLALDQPGGIITDARIALGAVGPTPIKATSASAVLIGNKPDDQTLKQAALAAREDARPINDHRGSAWYRQEMVELLTYRLLKSVLEKIEHKV
jgi:carbon-monoxide dehydrogenase medium subunit